MPGKGQEMQEDTYTRQMICRVNDATWRRVKSRAATEGRPMWAVVDEAMRLYLDTIEIVEQGQAQDAR